MDEGGRPSRPGAPVAAVRRAAPRERSRERSVEGQQPLTASDLFRRIGRIERLLGLARDLAVDLSWDIEDHERGLRARAAREPQAHGALVFDALSRSDRLAERINRLGDLGDALKSALGELVAALARRDESLDASHAPSPARNLRDAVEAFERRLVLSALQACEMRQNEAARLLGVPPTTLNEKLKRLGLRS